MSKKKRKKKKAGSPSAAPPSPAPAAVATASGREKLEEKIERLEQKLEHKKRAAFESSPGEDDASIPPVVEDEFFKKGDEPHPRVSAGLSGSFDAVPDPRSQRKLSPEVRARRAQLSKWVKAAVAVSATILAIAAFRVSLTRHKEEPVKVAAVIQAPVVDPQPVQQPVQTAQEQIQPPPVDPPKDDSQELDSKDPVVDSKDQPKDEPKEKPTRTAAQEKAMAQALLDGNNAGGAAAAAQRSVALDPHDAEAWLFLGAAYQMQGNNAAAKQAFTNCTTQAKRGPVGECKSMLSP